MEMIKDTFTDVKLFHNDQTTMLDACYGCSEEIEPHSWYYVVKGTNVNLERVLHKFCGELPTETSHPWHPLHVLKFQWSFVSPCGFCNRSGGFQLMFACDPCNIYVCLICGRDETLKLLSLKTPKEREKMALKDLSHHHQLKMLSTKNRQGDNDDDDDHDHDITTIQHCKACLQPIVDSTYYNCTEESEGCKDYSLHRFCAELPVQMEHELHPRHSLMLMLSPPLEHFKCSVCRKFCQGPTYSCRICSFQLHIICATSMSRVLEHKCHRHPLTLLPRPISSFCDACCRVQEGIFYQCNSCVGFFIHLDCASLGYVIFDPSHQGHPLWLGYRSDGIKQINNCDICFQKIYDESGWFYYCWECDFFTHLNCIISSDKDQEVQKIDPGIPCLPWKEADNEFGIVGLLNRNLRTIQNDEDDEMDTINHFSHPQHPLILQDDVPREVNPYSDGEITLITQCNGCSKQISAPLYSCATCRFYIHKGCALLPNSIPQHHAHSEHEHCRLVLLREPWDETRVFICHMCKEYCNGFSYQCEEESCNCKFDVECAFLPITISHQAHPLHPLHLVNTNRDQFRSHVNRVKCCRKSPTCRYFYICKTCGLMIHIKCAMYPGEAHHRFDCDRPFALSYNPSVIEPNKYHYCDICEDALDPKKWFYFSSKNGGQIMHHQCLFHTHRAGVTYPNFKSISSLFEVYIHPHPLHLHPTRSYSKCYHCSIRDHKKNGTEVQERSALSYQCGDCEYELHVRCANELFLQAREDVQEPVDKGISRIAGNIQQLYLEGSSSRNNE